MPAFYRATLADFLADDETRILGQLTDKSEGLGFMDLKHKQIKAWKKEITALKSCSSSLISAIPTSAAWSLLLEYPIPRRQKRIDALLIAVDILFCLEFKTEDKNHSLSTQRQAEDYALDLRDFHEESCDLKIYPVAVAMKAKPEETQEKATADAVSPVLRANSTDLAYILAATFKSKSNEATKQIEPSQWDSSSYKPVPTIVEAAEALFAGINVREIAHSHAGATNLTTTSEKIITLIQDAQKNNKKTICFVTGVPGAGKTLVGLNVVHNPTLRQNGRPPGIFLSGNGPLVKVISAAIEQDCKRRSKINGVARPAGTFIQNIHSFVKAESEKTIAPSEHVIVFDEAQRAWNAKHNEKKTGQTVSEPETVLSIMDRHTDWAVVVALVGGGQEIHDGEAGLAEWGQTLLNKFPNWQVAASTKALNGDSSVAGHKLFDDGTGSLNIIKEESLHLEVNLRTYKARQLTEWVNAVLAADANTAASAITGLKNFPLKLTRSLPTARAWLNEHARGLRRAGLVASSGAVRLRAEGIELSSGFRQGNRDMYVNWFLKQPPDIRSSNQLEIAASEFECQGLELDWVGLCWGGNFTFDLTLGWNLRRFSGNSWAPVKDEIDRRYLLNAYRVLLSRGREGMIIWIPQGDNQDATRSAHQFDQTAEFFKKCGLTEI